MVFKQYRVDSCAESGIHIRIERRIFC